MPPIKDTIELTELEQGLFGDLLSAVKEASLKTTLRCAGGWVRDKLMSRESLDIDIALDNMLGKEFADRVNDYLKAHGQEIHNIAVIMSNPEQSKHLETARMKIRGLWVDLVNLRSEEYAHHSRIPTMEFGTAEQDAQRRDFTINSLFYNINEGTVEDLTGKGLADLRQGIIRTPLPPKETFLDDPLRVLRAVRFASRFGFELEDSLLAAAQDIQVRNMLGHKVSRERIGAELDGMFKGPDPVRAISILHHLQLFEAVFEVHPSVLTDATTTATATTNNNDTSNNNNNKMLVEDFAAAGTALFGAAHDVHAAWAPSMNLAEKDGGDAIHQMMLAALLLPLRLMKVQNAKGKPQSMASHIARDSLKWKAKDAEAVDALHAVAFRLAAVQSSVANRDVVNDEVKIELGRCIRDLKHLFVPGLILASLIPSKAATPLGVESAVIAEQLTMLKNRTNVGDVIHTNDCIEDGDVESRVEVCKSIYNAAGAFGLLDCYRWKPVLDGKKVMAIMGLTRGGPELGRMMEKIVDWQLLNPQLGCEECQEMVLMELSSGSEVQKK